MGNVTPPEDPGAWPPELEDESMYCTVVEIYSGVDEGCDGTLIDVVEQCYSGITIKTYYDDGWTCVNGHGMIGYGVNTAERIIALFGPFSDAECKANCNNFY